MNQALRSLWMSLREQVSAFDEIDMATLRFRLRFPDEPASETPQPHIIERVEVSTGPLSHPLTALLSSLVSKN